MTPDDRWRVTHMVEAAEQALGFVQGRERAELAGDPMLLLALTRAVEIVGEAASKVSEAGREEIASLPWPRIIGVRNRLVHAYFDINPDILWDTVQLALPPMLEPLKAALGAK